MVDINDRLMMKMKNGGAGEIIMKGGKKKKGEKRTELMIVLVLLNFVVRDVFFLKDSTINCKYGANIGKDVFV